ncbi:helix-turn-helix domain-containing protein [Streptomyces microflavus]|nr:helix-turn-helix domain-containing protein [Streptomyces microflavus]
MFQMNGANYLTVRETAVRLGLHPGSIRNWRANGTEPIESMKLGSSVFYNEADVMRLAAERAR